MLVNIRISSRSFNKIDYICFADGGGGIFLFLSITCIVLYLAIVVWAPFAPKEEEGDTMIGTKLMFGATVDMLLDEHKRHKESEKRDSNE